MFYLSDLLQLLSRLKADRESVEGCPMGDASTPPVHCHCVLDSLMACVRAIKVFIKILAAGCIGRSSSSLVLASGAWLLVWWPTSNIWFSVCFCTLTMSVSECSTRVAFCSLRQAHLACFVVDIYWWNDRIGWLLLTAYMSWSGYRNICTAKLTDDFPPGHSAEASLSSG